MFELEEAIKNWRDNLLQSQTLQPSDADELESHVRDETDTLMLGGLSAEEAFMVSTYRIGDSTAVAQEYAKVNTKEVWRNRVFWMLSGVFTFMVIGSLSSFLSAGTRMILAMLDMHPSVSGLVSSSVYVSVFIGAVFVLVRCLGGILSKIYRRYRTFRNVLLQGILLIFFLKIITVFMPAFYVRVYGVEEFGKIALFSRYILVGWRIIWPVLLAALLLWLRPSKRQAT